MKNIILTFTLVLLLVLFFTTCEKNDKEPKLEFDATEVSEITTPADGSSFVLTLADSANPFVVEWTATEYVTTQDATIPTPTYIVQIAFKDTTENEFKDLYSTKDLFYDTTYYSFNVSLLNLGMAADSTGDIDMRILSEISGANSTEVTSDVIGLTVTTFEPPSGLEPDIITISPVGATIWDEITLTLDAKLSCPDGALLAADSVMLHSGLTIDGEDWQSVIDFDGVGADGTVPKLVHNGDSTWSITYTPGAYYGIAAGANVTQICCVFNAGDWAAGEGKNYDDDGNCTDFFIPIGN